MEIEKILRNKIRTGLFSFFTNKDISGWSYNFTDNEYTLHKIYEKKHLYMIIYLSKVDNYDIYQCYYELNNDIYDDGTCPIINGKIKYDTVQNIILINNELHMICHQNYIYNELLLFDLKNKCNIIYDNGGSTAYSIEKSIIEGNNYIFYIKTDDIIIDIFINPINKNITIYENNKLEYFFNYNIYIPSL